MFEFKFDLYPYTLKRKSLLNFIDLQSGHEHYFVHYNS